MATYSSVLVWRIPGMGEPGGLPSMGSHRVGHDWVDLAAVAAADIDEEVMLCRRNKAQSHQERHLPLALESKSIAQWSCEGQVIKGHMGQALNLRALVSTNTNETFNTFQSYWKCKRIEGSKSCCIKKCHITEMETNILRWQNLCSVVCYYHFLNCCHSKQ